MTAQEFIRRLRKLARKQSLSLRIDSKRGSGDHEMVWLDGQVTTLPGKKGELPTGTFRKICKDLGIDPNKL